MLFQVSFLGMPNTQNVMYRTEDVDMLCEKRRSERLFKRCDTPTLPLNDSLYAKAKRLEYDGDISGAMDMLFKAMHTGDRVDSCMKDIAGLLNMMGRTYEAVEFLKAHQDKVTNKVGYSNLLIRLQNDLERSEVSELPRSLTVKVTNKSLGAVTMGLCDRLFPNPSKVRRILHTDDEGYVGAIHFASHSSARKAMQVQKNCIDQVFCSWSSLYTDARLRMLEKLEKDNISSSSIVSCMWEKMPTHLSDLTIPIYRDSDPTLPVLSLEEIKRIQAHSLERVEGAMTAATSEAGSSDVPTVFSPITSAESVVMATVLANHQHLFGAIDVGGLSPFMTKIPTPSNGRFASALVIPLPAPVNCSDPDETEQVRSYAHTLSLMSSAMFTVASVMDSPSESVSPFLTPVKQPRRIEVSSFSTPSPVIQRNMFT